MYTHHNWESAEWLHERTQTQFRYICDEWEKGAGTEKSSPKIWQKGDNGRALMEPLLKDRAIHSQGKRKTAAKLTVIGKLVDPSSHAFARGSSSIDPESIHDRPAIQHAPFGAFHSLRLHCGSSFNWQNPCAPPCLPLLLYVAPLSRGAQSQCSHILPHLRFAYIPSRILRKQHDNYVCFFVFFF